MTKRFDPKRIVEVKARSKAIRVKPTDGNPYIKPKHRAIFERMKQGETITGAMIAMSYSPSVVDRPTQITRSKSWAMLMDEQLPEDVVARRHREILDARKYRTVVTGRGKNRREERVDDGVDPIVVKGVELAYKLRGRTAGDAPPAERAHVYNLFFNPVVQQNVRTFEDALKKTIAYEVDRPVVEEVRPSADEPVTDGVDDRDAGTVEEIGDPDGAEHTG